MAPGIRRRMPNVVKRQPHLMFPGRTQPRLPPDDLAPTDSIGRKVAQGGASTPPGA